MKHIELPEDHSLVLQEVGERGEEEMALLAETMSYEKAKLIHIVQSLQHKGLISLNRSSGHGVWIRLSAKGRKLMHNLWPEADMQYTN